MPFLGYTMLLPPGFERVADDPDAPVPSSVDIGERDPQTAAALSAAAQRIARQRRSVRRAGPVVGRPGLAAAAGRPGRASRTGSTRRSYVRSSSRRSRSGPRIWRTPSSSQSAYRPGDGFLAVVPGCDRPCPAPRVPPADTDRAVPHPGHYPAGTGRRRPESDRPGHRRVAACHPGFGRGPCPTPARLGQDGADPALEATLPDHSVGLDADPAVRSRASRWSRRSTPSPDRSRVSWVGWSTRPATCPSPSPCRTDGTAPLLIAAYRLHGVTAGQPPRRSSTRSRTTSGHDARVAGRDVRVSVVGRHRCNRTWLHVAPGPDGDAVLYQVDAGRAGTWDWPRSSALP